MMKLFIALAAIDFIMALGRYVCFFELLILMGSLQWFGSNIWLTENLRIGFRPGNHYYETMFSFTLILAMGLLFFKPSRLEQKTKVLINKLSEIPDIDKYGKFFFYMGFIFSFLSSVVGNIATIGQLIYLFAQLGYVSMICFLFSKSPQRVIYILITFTYTIITCITTTLFWPIIFWSLFFFIIYAMRRRVSLPLKLILLGAGAFLVVFVQSFKQQLRFETTFRPDYLEPRSGTFSAFSSLAEQRLSTLGASDFNKVFLGTFFMRINQGTWDNLVINRVDQKGSFLNGESIYSAAAGAFIPRFLWPNKPKFDNSLLSRLLGTNIRAFISISILAEAYVNFGFKGGCLFMLIYAILLSSYYRMILRWSFRKTPLYFVFFPFLFYTFTRAEVDFVQTIYSMVSSTVTLLLIFYILQRLGFLKRTAFLTSQAQPNANILNGKQLSPG